MIDKRHSAIVRSTAQTSQPLVLIRSIPPTAYHGQVLETRAVPITILGELRT